MFSGGLSIPMVLIYDIFIRRKFAIFFFKLFSFAPQYCGDQGSNDVWIRTKLIVFFRRPNVLVFDFMKVYKIIWLIGNLIYTMLCVSSIISILGSNVYFIIINNVVVVG